MLNDDLELYLQYPNKTAVGVDLEWKPISTETDVIIPSILQLSIDNHISIIDLYTLCFINKKCIINYIIVNIVSNYINNIFKYHNIYGFGIINDIEVLKDGYNELNIDETKYKIIDLNCDEVMNCLGCKYLSLKILSNTLLKCDLDKTCQISNWQDRPLTTQQV